jgi:hypothetical protein
MYRHFSGDNGGSERYYSLSDKSETSEYMVIRPLGIPDGLYATDWPPRLAILLQGADSATLACEVCLEYRCNGFEAHSLN